MIEIVFLSRTTLPIFGSNFGNEQVSGELINKDIITKLPTTYHHHLQSLEDYF
jgi:hypothetical protein